MDREIVRLGDEIGKARARRQLARDELNKLSGARLRLDSLRDNLDELGHRLEEADLSAKKRLLSGLVSRIEVDPDERHAIVHVRHFVFDHTVEHVRHFVFDHTVDLRLADSEFS